MKKRFLLFFLLIIFLLSLRPQTKSELNKQLFDAVNSGKIDRVNSLIKQGVDVNVRDKNNQSPLFKACQKGNLNIVMLLVQNGAVWDEAIPWNGFPIFHAAEEGHQHIVEYFSSLGFDMKKKDLEGFTLFHWAASSKDKGFLDYLISKYPEYATPVLQEDWRHRAALLNAIRKAHEDYEVWRSKNEIDLPHVEEKKYTRDYEAKIRNYEKTLRKMQEEKNPKGETEVLNHLGRAYHDSGQYTKAISCFERALAISRENNYRRGEENALINLGPPYYALGQYDKGYSYYEEGLKIRRTLADPIAEAKRLNELGLSNEHLKEYKIAVSCYEKALAIVRKLKNTNREEVLLNNLVIAHFRLKEYAKALSYFEKGMLIRQAATKEKKDPTVFNKMGLAYYESSQFEKAVEYYKKALDINRSANDQRQEAQSLGNLGDAYSHLSQFYNAESSYRQALQIIREMKDKKNEANLLRRFASLYEQFGCYPEAIKYCSQSLNINREIKNVEEEKETLSLFGKIYYSSDRYEKADHYYRKAVEIMRKTGDREGEVEHLVDRGMVSIALNQPLEAIQKFEKALAINNEINKRKAQLQKEAAEIPKIHRRNLIQSIYSGDPFPFYSQALNAKLELQAQKKEAKIFRLLGEAYAGLGSLSQNQAIENFEQALRISRKAKDRKEESDILNNLGLAYYRLADYKKAVNFYEQALAKARNAFYPKGKVAVFSNLGRLYSTASNHDKAIFYYRKAIKISRQLGMADVEAIDKIDMAHSFYELHRETEAITPLEEAITIKKGIRSSLAAEGYKASFFESYLKAYKLLFRLYFDIGNFHKALKTAEASKSVVFAEMMAKRGAREKVAAGNPEFQKYLSDEKNLSIRIHNLKKTLENANGKIKDRLNENLDKLYQEQNDLWEKMKQTFPLYAQFLSPDSLDLDLEKIKTLLFEDETYISYYLLEDYAVAFVVNKDSFHAVKLEVERQWIRETIAALRQEMTNANLSMEYFSKGDMRRFPKFFDSQSHYIHYSSKLYQVIFKPLLPFIRSKKITLSADGVLYGFPLEALVTRIPTVFNYKSQEYSLIEIKTKKAIERVPLFYEFRQLGYLGEVSEDGFRLSYIPTASSLSILRDKHKAPKRKVKGIIAFADPVFSSGTEEIRNADKEWLPAPLPETAEEAEIFINRIGRGKLYKGLEATEENVWKAGLEKAKYVLFSTHGILAGKLEGKNIFEPALLLTLVNNPTGYDGYLEMTEAAGLRLNSDVVILSACSSAGESGKGGEGFAGLARSFLFAGSQAVVASHWQVESKATKMLMEHYGKYLNTNGTLEALEEARSEVKNAVVEYGNEQKIKVSYAHPYFWASFVLLGER